MEMLDLLRFFLGSAMLCYGSWTDLKTRRVPNEVWLVSGSIASALLIYDLSTQNWGYHVWALLFATIILFYNAFIDEYVLEENQTMLWRIFQVLAILSALYFLLTVDSEEISSENYKLVDILSISILMILMYVWYYLGPTIGGADVKAIMTIGLVAPFTISFSEEPLMAFEIRGFPYPFVIFMNSLLLYLLIPLGLALYNLFKGNIEKPYFQIFFGTKMPVKEARKSFVWPMQQVVGDKAIMVAFVKYKSDSESQWDKLEEKGITNPWITFKIPYIIPLTLAFFVSAFFGDLFSVYLVEPINSILG
jgi:Flp pilus assembly protein protease CpaA